MINIYLADAQTCVKGNCMNGFELKRLHNRLKILKLSRILLFPINYWTNGMPEQHLSAESAVFFPLFQRMMLKFDVICDANPAVGDI